ncbi:hypothetical protein [Mycobacteroides salmoniphilum]|nr:hypothetical protein [Mycobacteroides salmoniphilum]
MTQDDIGRIFREEYGRTVATLICYFGKAAAEASRAHRLVT